MIIQFSNDGKLLYSTYFGDIYDDFFESLVVDSEDNVIVSGYSSSNDYPISSDAYQNRLIGSINAVMTKLSKEKKVIWSTYFGGSSYDYGSNLAIDREDNLYIHGYTSSFDLPTLPDVFQPKIGGASDCFLAKFDINGKFQWLRYVCGSGYEEGADGIALVFQNSSPYALGWSGGGIGYDGIKNSIAIEFDTFSNDSTQIENLFDPNGNHIAVQCNGANENTSKHYPDIKLALNDNIPIIHSDGRIYYVSVNYNPQSKTMTVYFDSTKYLSKPVIVLRDYDLSKLINLENNISAYIGITGATGCAFQNQDILSWDLCIDKAFVTDVDEDTEADEELFSISPNPASDRLILSTRMEHKGDIEIKLINVLGLNPNIPIRNQNWVDENTIEIDLREIPAGFYLLIFTQNNISYTRKIICSKIGF